MVWAQEPALRCLGTGGFRNGGDPFLGNFSGQSEKESACCCRLGVHGDMFNLVSVPLVLSLSSLVFILVTPLSTAENPCIFSNL